jgi:hypothetical protein
MNAALPHQAKQAAPFLGQPDGHRRLRVHRVRRAGSEGDGRAVRAHGLQADRPAPPQERDAVPPGRHQLHHQRRAGFVRAALRAPARPEHLRDRVPRAGRQGGVRARDLEKGAWGYADQAGPGIEHPGHQGHRRQPDLPRRPLARQERRQAGDIGNIGFYDVDFEPMPGIAPERAQPGRLRPDLHRPPDAQRAPRPHGRMVGVLRAAVQLPRGPLLRHRGPGHRRQEQGDDQPLRQDPHPDQRGRQREGRPDPGIPGQVPRRRHPAHRAGVDATCTTRWTRCSWRA